MLELDFEYGFIEDTKACARAEHAVRKLKVGFWSMWFLSKHQLTLILGELSLCLILKRKKEENSCIF